MLKQLRSLASRLSRRRPVESAERLARLSAKLGIPRVVVVKQDINEDLYCCRPNSSARDIVASTLLRTGPVDLFADWGAAFLIVETVDDPECRIWQERATHLKWDSLEFFRSYRDRVPGRDYGQRDLAVPVGSVDWSRFDIVVSIDNSVPARITKEYPETLWTYYVREIKAPAYGASHSAPLPGQDRLLNHFFRPSPPPLPTHVLEFPYHVQSVGCFHRLFEHDVIPDDRRSGVFVDHHSMVRLSAEERQSLKKFGPLTSPVHLDGHEVVPTSQRLARRTIDPDLREALLGSRYFLVTPGQRHVFGTAVVEAIAAGCLAVGSRKSLINGFLLPVECVADDAASAVELIRKLEANEEVRTRCLRWQRHCVNTLCHDRPLADLLRAWANKRGWNG